jgi:hypothetical protein
MPAALQNPAYRPAGALLDDERTWGRLRAIQGFYEFVERAHGSHTTNMDVTAFLRESPQG